MYVQFRSIYRGLAVAMGSKQIRFSNGRYVTNDPTEIKHLTGRRGVIKVMELETWPPEGSAVAPEPAAEPKIVEPPEPADTEPDEPGDDTPLD